MNRLNRMIRDEFKVFKETRDRTHLRESVLLQLTAMAIRCCQDESTIQRCGAHDCWNGGEKNLKDGRYTYRDPLWDEYMESGCIWDFEVWRLYRGRGEE